MKHAPNHVWTAEDHQLRIAFYAGQANTFTEQCACRPVLTVITLYPQSARTALSDASRVHLLSAQHVCRDISKYQAVVPQNVRWAHFYSYRAVWHVVLTV